MVFSYFCVMKARFLHSITLVLAAVMLLSASGIVVGKMICLKTGREIVKINSASDSCCPEPEQEAELDKQCCLYKSYGIATDNFLQTSQVFVKAPVWIAVTAQQLPAISTLLTSQPLPVQVCSKPPPRSVRVVLQLNQTFLI
jgi:hypothetical protein